MHNATDGYTERGDQNIAHKRSRESARFMERPAREYELSQTSHSSRGATMTRNHKYSVPKTVRRLTRREYDPAESNVRHDASPEEEYSSRRSGYSPKSYDSEEDDDVSQPLLKP